MATYNVDKTSKIDGSTSSPLVGATFEQVIIYLKLNTEAQATVLAESQTPEGATVERATATYVVHEVP